MLAIGHDNFSETVLANAQVAVSSSQQKIRCYAFLRGVGFIYGDGYRAALGMRSVTYRSATADTAAPRQA